MARSSRGRRSPRMKVDWITLVQTYQQFTDAYALSEFDGTVSLPLTIADKNRKLNTGRANQVDSLQQQQTWSAIPEGNRGTVLAVRGQLQMFPQEPLFGGTRGMFAVRLAIHDQDADTLGAIVDPFYDLGVNPPGPLNEAAAQANDRFLWERKYVWQASQGTAEGLSGERIVDIHWSGRRSLNPNQALFLDLEVGLNSTSFFFSPWLRTLMRVGE